MNYCSFNQFPLVGHLLCENPCTPAVLTLLSVSLWGCSVEVELLGQRVNVHIILPDVASPNSLYMFYSAFLLAMPEMNYFNQPGQRSVVSELLVFFNL